MGEGRHTGKSAVVTGGVQGIGAGIARLLFEQGANVAIVDRQGLKEEEFGVGDAKDGQKIISITADIATRHGCEQAMAEALSELGSLDILVNNAAPGRDKSQIGSLAGADWTEHSEVVLQAAAWLSEAALPSLRQSASPAIVNISSVTAGTIAPSQCSWPYHVSKAGLEQLTRYLACQFGKDNIRVNAVAPGLVDRDTGVKISDNPKNRRIIENIVPLQRAASAREIGHIVSFLCSEEASYLTAQVLTADGGMGAREVFGASLDAVDNS